MQKLIPLILGLTLFSSPGHAQLQFTVENQIFQANPVARNSGNMANSLLAMSLASLGSVMLTTCRTVSGAPLPDSVVAFSNTSFAYISAEIQAANQHKADINLRNAGVQGLADRMRRDGGGEVQKLAFEEARIERQYLQDFIGIRRSWIASLIIGFNNAASIASGEPINDDTTIICTGTVAAARTVASQLGSAFNAVIGAGPTETVSGYLNDVLDIVANQILPLSERPDGRVVVAAIAADSATGVLGELGPQFDSIGTNIANISEVINEFETSNGVAADTGVTASRGQGPSSNLPPNTTATTNLASTSGSTSTSTSTASGSASVNQASTGSSAVNVRVKSCAEKTPDGKSLAFKEMCTTPVKFPAPGLKNGSIATKSAADATSRLANALAIGDIEAAKVAAGTLNSLAAQVIVTRSSVVKNKNLELLKSGRPMIDLDGDTKKALTKMTSEITTSVTNKGGGKLLASSAPAMIPEPKTAVEIPQTENLKDLPPRLRGRNFVAVRKVETTEVAGTGTNEMSSTKEENLSLWQRLSNRYQSHYDKFLERKNP